MTLRGKKGYYNLIVAALTLEREKRQREQKEVEVVIVWGFRGEG